MDRDAIMGMAAQAVQDTEKDCRSGAIVPFVLRFAALVAAAEREACAQAALSEPRVWDDGAPDPQHRIAAAIRARGDAK